MLCQHEGRPRSKGQLCKESMRQLNLMLYLFLLQQVLFWWFDSSLEKGLKLEKDRCKHRL